MATEKQIVLELKENHPAIYEKVLLSLDDVPSPFPCVDRLFEVVNSYCYHKGIEVTHLTDNNKGQKAQAKARQELFAVLLYLAHPMKLFGIKESPYPELMNNISRFFSDDYKNVSFHIRSAIGFFEVEKTFRAETIRLADLVRSDLVTA